MSTWKDEAFHSCNVVARQSQKSQKYLVIARIITNDTQSHVVAKLMVAKYKISPNDDQEKKILNQIHGNVVMLEQMLNICKYQHH